MTTGNGHGAACECAAARRFYTEVIEEFSRSPFETVVGGTYALGRYIGVRRQTKDIDLFIRPGDARRALRYFADRGYDAELTYPHWLGKVRRGPFFMDLIFSSGNGVARVDDAWFEHAVEHTLFDRPVRLCPPEEMIWSKAFVQERERYDGADVIHLLHHCGRRLDWDRLLKRFGPNWRVLFSFIVLHGFVYPAERDRIPSGIVNELVARFAQERENPGSAFCNGALLSREQYLPDVDAGGYEDPRLAPAGGISAEQLARWTAAIGEDH